MLLVVLKHILKEKKIFFDLLLIRISNIIDTNVRIEESKPIIIEKKEESNLPKIVDFTVVEPKSATNIQKGDNILCIDGVKVDNNQSLLNILSSCKKGKVNLLIERNDKKFETSIDIVISKNNQKSIGLYIKDKLIGIGTVTFIDPNGYYFGSLGHGIYNDNELLDVSNGLVLSSSVNSIRKATPGNAGEKKATIDNIGLK